MIDRCFNPNCRRQLHYLRDGRVVRLITGTGSSQVIEHFWLCGPCFEEYDFALRDGMIFLEAKPGAERPRTDFQYAEVLVLYLERPATQRGVAARSSWGRSRYSDLKEAALTEAYVL